MKRIDVDLEEGPRSVKRYNADPHYRVGRPWQVTSYTSREQAQRIFELADEGLSIRDINFELGYTSKNKGPARLLSDRVFWDPYIDHVVVERVLRGSEDLLDLLTRITFYEYQAVEADILTREPWLIDPYHDTARADEREAWLKLPLKVRDNIYRHRASAVDRMREHNAARRKKRAAEKAAALEPAA